MCFSSFCLVALAPAAFLAGCHTVDNNDIPKHGSELDKARARETIGAQQSNHPVEPPPNADDILPKPAPTTHPGKVPTPPTADQISPDSPQAVLNGTSTTQPAAPQTPH